ncbi:MAG: ricin-type beta-trefoil lectin domain protein [Oceanococcus sp.]
MSLFTLPKRTRVVTAIAVMTGLLASAPASAACGLLSGVLGTCPSVSISATPNNGPVGGSTTLTWSSSRANSCTASGDWAGGKALSGSGSVNISRIGANNFTLTCANGSDTTSQTASVSGRQRNAGDLVNDVLAATGQTVNSADMQQVADATSSLIARYAPGVTVANATVDNVKTAVQQALNTPFLNREKTRELVQRALANPSSWRDMDLQSVVVTLLHPYVKAAGLCTTDPNNSNIEDCAFVMQAADGQEIKAQIKGANGAATNVPTVPVGSDLEYILSMSPEQCVESMDGLLGDHANAASVQNGFKSYALAALGFIMPAAHASTTAIPDAETCGRIFIGQVFQYKIDFDIWSLTLQVNAEVDVFGLVQNLAYASDTLTANIPIAFDCGFGCLVQTLFNCFDSLTSGDLENLGMCMANYATKPERVLHAANSYGMTTQARTECNVYPARSDERPYFQDLADNGSTPPDGQGFVTQEDLRLGTYNQQSPNNSSSGSASPQLSGLTGNNEYSSYVSYVPAGAGAPYPEATYSTNSGHIGVENPTWWHAYNNVTAWNFNIVLAAANAMPTLAGMSSMDCQFNQLQVHPSEPGIFVNGDQAQFWHGSAAALDEMNIAVGWKSAHAPFLCAAGVATAVNGGAVPGAETGNFYDVADLQDGHSPPTAGANDLCVAGVCLPGQNNLQGGGALLAILSDTLGDLTGFTQESDKFRELVAGDGTCLDVREHTMQNGQQVIHFPCHGLGNQAWKYDAATKQLRARTNSNYCLDSADNNGNTSLGHSLKIWSCLAPDNVSIKNQQWNWVAGQWRNANNNNWAISATATPYGTQIGNVVLQQSNLSDSKQKWEWGPSYPIVSRELRTADGLCLELNNESVSNNSALIAWDCNGGASQVWSYHAASKMLRNGNRLYCMDNGGNAYAGGGLKLFTCDSATGQYANNVRWDISGDQFLSTINSGLAVAAPANGQRGQLTHQASNPDAPNQQWTWGRAEGWEYRELKTDDGRCVDDYGYAVGTYGCNNGNNQRFIYDPLTKRIHVKSNKYKCLQADSRAHGAWVRMVDCMNYSGNPDNISWYAEGDQIRTGVDLNLALTAPSGSNEITLYPANTSNAAQNWHWED